MRQTGVGRAIVAAVIATTGWSAVSCSLLFDKRGEAQGIERQLRTMPGVAGTDLTYNAGIDAGLNFGLTVRLKESATEQQAVDVGRAFVHERTAKGLDDHVGDLNVKYPAAEDTGDAIYDASEASFTFGPSDGTPDPTERQVADGIGLWVRVTRSPVANTVRLFEPNRRGELADPNITITLRLTADPAAAAELQRDTPGLEAASWEYAVPFDNPVERRSYVSTPFPPTASDMELWREISDTIGIYYHAKGSTDSNVGLRQALTEVEIDIPRSSDATENVARIIPAVAALLPRFGHPAALSVDVPDGQIELVVGGCFQHRPNHVRLPLEVELSRRYETC
jgi:hypothetical protein